MKIPSQYVPDLDHRITALMTFTVRRDSGWFDPDHGEEKNLGDVYRASLEGAAIMLRILIEFLGLNGKCENGHWKLGKPPDLGDVRLGKGLLSRITPADHNLITPANPILAALIAKMYGEVSKRTAHSAFNKIGHGLDLKDLREATKWVVNEIWKRCYDPAPITVHRDLFRLLPGGQWEGIRFKEAT
jgi:hypothetical protein